MSRSTTQLTSTSRTRTETGNSISSRNREKTEDLYEMIFAMTNVVICNDNVVILFRGKLRDRIRKALHQRQFTTIEQFMDRLKTSFRMMRDIFEFYADLKKFCVKNRENVVDYIDRVQDSCMILLKREGAPYKCRHCQNKWSICARVLCELPSDIRRKTKWIFIHRNVLHGRKGESWVRADFRVTSPVPTKTTFRRANGEIKGIEDYNRKDSREQFNDILIPRNANNRKSESAIIGNERNPK